MNTLSHLHVIVISIYMSRLYSLSQIANEIFWDHDFTHYMNTLCTNYHLTRYMLEYVDFEPVFDKIHG